MSFSDQQVETKESKVPALRMNPEGLVIVETLEEELRVCAALVSARMVPESLDTPQKLFAARQLCRELNLPVVSATRQVYVVNGSPSLWGDTPLALVRRSKCLESIDEFFVDKDYNRICLQNKNFGAEIFAAVCNIKRKGEEVAEFVFTMEEARRADLTNKAIWKKYPKRMIQMKARGLALKNVFSDVLMGVAMAEYDFDEVPGSQVRDVDETAKKANDFFKPGNSPQQGAVNGTDNNDTGASSEAGSAECREISGSDEQHFRVEELAAVDHTGTDHTRPPWDQKKKHRDQAVSSI